MSTEERVDKIEKDLKEQVDKIEGDLKKLEAKEKDFYDKASAIGVPIVVAIVGFIVGFHQSCITNAHNKNELRVTKEVEKSKIRIAELANNIKTAEMVPKFFEKLYSDDPNEVEFAADTIIFGATDAGPRLMRSFRSKHKQTDSVTDSIDKSLIEKRDTTIQKLFSDQRSERFQAYSQLRDNWGSDENMIDALILFAEQNLDNEDGIYNTLVLLSHMNKETIRNKKDEISVFTQKVKDQSIGPKINERVEKLNSRIK